MATGRSPVRIDPELIIAHKFPEATFSYDERDVALYALGVGACGGDAVDEKELKYVYHRDGQQSIQGDIDRYGPAPFRARACFQIMGISEVLPTFVALFPFKSKKGFLLADVPGLDFDPKLLLHGQQYIEIYRPLPSNCSVENRVAIVGLHDKGKAAIVEVETTSYARGSGEALCMNRATIYLRGAGGFSKNPKAYSYATNSRDQVPSIVVPGQKPSVIYEDKTQQSQALLYRLSGDYNPLHSDSIVAAMAGFNRPILHGLCTLGFAIRAIIRSVCNGNPTVVKSIFARFLLHVFPGETLITEIWIEGPKIIYQTKVKERNKVVLLGCVMLNHIGSSL